MTSWVCVERFAGHCGSMLSGNLTLQQPFFLELTGSGVANSYSRCHRQLVEFAAVRLPAETVECCLPINAFATDFSWRLAT